MTNLFKNLTLIKLRCKIVLKNTLTPFVMGQFKVYVVAYYLPKIFAKLISEL